MFAEIIELLGEEKASSYFRARFAKPENIHEFCSIFGSHLRKKMPAFHKEILTESTKGGRFAGVAPRGGAKSTLTDVFVVAWQAFHTKKHFILIISDTHTQAKMQLASLKYEIETNPLISWLYPNIQGEPWGEDRILLHGTHGDVMIIALGSGMKIRGLRFRNHRPDFVVIDDLENSESVQSAEQRKKTERWFQYDLLRALDRDNASIMYIGTIMHHDALMKQAVDKRNIFAGWRTKFYKALQPDGTSLWNEMWTPEYLKAIRDDPKHPDYVGTYVFAQEMQNEPQDDRDRVIKLEWLKEYNYRAKVAQFTGDTFEQREAEFLKTLKIFGGVDPSISQKETADYFCFYTFGEDKDGNEWELDLVRGRFSMDEQAKLIIDGYKKWKHELIGIEVIAYQQALNQAVRKEAQKQHLSLRTKPIKTDKDKIRRARIHSISFESGFVHFRSDHPLTETLRQEILDFPSGAHDDTFDSMMLAKETRNKPVARVFKNKPAGF